MTNSGLVARVMRTVACAMAVAGCHTDHIGGPNDTPHAALFPLGIGTRWTYDRVDSVEFATDPLLKTFHSTVSFSVLADTIGNGTTWAVLENTNDIVGGLISGHEYAANLQGGTWTWLVPTGTAFGAGLPAFLDYPYPATKGATSNFGNTAVLSTDSTVTVPAGTFHCIVYAQLRDRVFVAPGVGVVWRSLGDVPVLDANGKLVDRFQVFYSLKSVDVH